MVNRLSVEICFYFMSAFAECSDALDDILGFQGHFPHVLAVHGDGEVEGDAPDPDAVVGLL